MSGKAMLTAVSSEPMAVPRPTTVTPSAGRMPGTVVIAERFPPDPA